MHGYTRHNATNAKERRAKGRAMIECEAVSTKGNAIRGNLSRVKRTIMRVIFR